MKLIINRISQDETQTLGLIKLIGSGKVEEYPTVELPWKQNTTYVSCIPTGRYKASRLIHDKFKKCLVIHDVPGRTGILMHVANHFHQLRGCIAPGMGFTDIDRDGHVDVLQSRLAINAIYDSLPDDFIVEINHYENHKKYKTGGLFSSIRGK